MKNKDISIHGDAKYILNNSNQSVNHYFEGAAKISVENDKSKQTNKQKTTATNDSNNNKLLSNTIHAFSLRICASRRTDFISCSFNNTSAASRCWCSDWYILHEHEAIIMHEVV